MLPLNFCALRHSFHRQQVSCAHGISNLPSLLLLIKRCPTGCRHHPSALVSVIFRQLIWVISIIHPLGGLLGIANSVGAAGAALDAQPRYLYLAGGFFAAGHLVYGKTAMRIIGTIWDSKPSGTKNLGALGPWLQLNWWRIHTNNYPAVFLFLAARLPAGMQFMLNEGPIGYDKRVLPTLERAIADFRKGVRYLEGTMHFLDVPYKGGTLPAYLYLSPDNKKFRTRKTPILVNSGGGNSTQEEIYFINISIGPSLGYAVLTFDGPGQDIVLRRDKLPMRPD